MSYLVSLAGIWFLGVPVLYLINPSDLRVITEGAKIASLALVIIWAIEKLWEGNRRA